MVAFTSAISSASTSKSHPLILLGLFQPKMPCSTFKFFEAIELNKVTKAILEKNKDTPFKDGKALPNYSNQAMNRDIKELCHLADIDEEIRVTTYKGNVRTDESQLKWELVGTHTGRRTFIVNALSMGITPNVVMKWTSHSDYKAMMPYIDIVDSIKASSMAKFNDLL